MKATCYCLVLFGLSFAANALAAEENAGGTPSDKGETIAGGYFVTSGNQAYFPTVVFKLEGQDQESKYPDERGAPYGRIHPRLICDRLYQVRFDPPDYAYSFAASGDRMLKMMLFDAKGGPLMKPPVLLALPVPTTPFYFKVPSASPEHYPQVHSMGEFNAATTTVWFLRPAEKGATGPYADSNLYVKMYGSCMMLLEDSTVKPTIAVVEPEGGETVSGILMAKARVTENTGVSTMDFVVDGVTIGADSMMYQHATPLYRAVMDTRMLADGPHEIHAVMYCASSAIVPSEKVTFTVKNASPAKTPPNTPDNK